MLVSHFYSNYISIWSTFLEEGSEWGVYIDDGDCLNYVSYLLHKYDNIILNNL